MAGPVEEHPPADARERGRARPPHVRVDRDLLARWLTPEGLTALLALAAAVAAMIAGAVNLAGNSPVAALLVLGLVALPLTVVGVVLTRRVAGEAAPPPRDPPPFAGALVGRSDDITTICRALRDRNVVSVAGRRGIGTSACAKKAVERLADEPLADLATETLYLDLRPENVPLGPAEVADELARILGLEGSTDAAQVRNALSATRRLLVLDNADVVGQVAPFLPAAGQHHKLLVAGTVTLTNIEPIELHPLPPGVAAGIALPIDGEPDERWSELAELCGCQPRVVAAAGDLIHKERYDLDGLLTAVHRVVDAPPHVSSTTLVNEARQSLQFLAEQDIGYAALSARSRRLLRRLALLPAVPEPSESGGGTAPSGEGGRLTLCRADRDTMGVVAGLRDDRLIAALNELADAGLLGQPGELRSLRPLHAPLARLHLLRDEPALVRRRAHSRLLKHLARQAEAHAATRSVENNRWFAQHEVLLRATVAAATSPVDGSAQPLPPGARRWWFRLAVALCVWYAAEGRLDAWAATAQAVEALPRRVHQVVPTAALEVAWRASELAAVERRRERTDEAQALLAAAADAMPGWRHLGEAQIRTNQALVLERRAQRRRDGSDDGDDEGRVAGRVSREVQIRVLLAQALEMLDEARPLRSPSDTIGQALTDHVAGITYRHLARSDHELAELTTRGQHPPGDVRPRPDPEGHMAAARRHLVLAANRFREADELRGEAAALTNLVLVAGEMRNTGIALQTGRAALAVYDDLRARTGRDDTLGRAAALLNLGAVLVTAGGRENFEQAKERLTQSRDLRGETMSRGLGRTLLYLGDAEMGLGDEATARRLWSEARAVFEHVGDTDGLDAAARRPHPTAGAGGR